MRSKEVIHAMQKDSEGQTELQDLMVDGGITTNDIIMQHQANLLGKNVITKQETEVTAVGAGIAAGLHAGIWKDLDEVREMSKI
jgi:glycerol kinase